MKNIERIVRQINLVYYLIYTSTILTSMIGYFLTMNTENQIDYKNNFNLGLSSLIIVYVVASIPLALGIYYRNLKKIRAIEDPYLKSKKYIASAQLRLLLVGIGVVVSIVAHFILYVHTANFSMIFAAGIAAMVVLYCKPSVNKVANELELEIED